MGGFTLLLALFYGLLAYGILMRHREQVNLSMFSVGVALVLLSIAVPVQLDGPWIAPAWAVQGTALVWLSFFIRMPQLRWFGVAAFIVTLGWLLISEMAYWADLFYIYDRYLEFAWPILNLRFLSYAIIIVVATYVAALPMVAESGRPISGSGNPTPRPSCWWRRICLPCGRSAFR